MIALFMGWLMVSACANILLAVAIGTAQMED